MRTEGHEAKAGQRRTCQRDAQRQRPENMFVHRWHSQEAQSEWRGQRNMINGGTCGFLRQFTSSLPISTPAPHEWLQLAERWAGLQTAMITVINWERKPRRATVDQHYTPVMFIRQKDTEKQREGMSTASTPDRVLVLICRTHQRNKRENQWNAAKSMDHCLSGSSTAQSNQNPSSAQIKHYFIISCLPN